MNIIFVWLIAYVLPMLSALLIVLRNPKGWGGRVNANLLIIHVALLISITASQYTIHASGLVFPWTLNSLWILFYLGSVLLVSSMLGWFGIVYGLSALIQQSTMLSIAFILSAQFSLSVVILLVVPLYTLAHLLRTKYSFGIIFLFFAWGTISLCIFSLTHNLWLTAGLHALLGALLTKWGILFPKLEGSKKKF